MIQQHFDTLLSEVRDIVNESTLLKQLSPNVTTRKHLDGDLIVAFVLVGTRLLIERYTEECIPKGNSIHTTLTEEQSAALQALIVSGTNPQGDSE